MRRLSQTNFSRRDAGTLRERMTLTKTRGHIVEHCSNGSPPPFGSKPRIKWNCSRPHSEESQGRFQQAIAFLLQCRGLFDERDARFDLPGTANNFFEGGFDLADAQFYFTEGENYFPEGKNCFSKGENHSFGGEKSFSETKN